MLPTSGWTCRWRWCGLNLGWVRGCGGTYPGALRYLDLAEAQFRELGTTSSGWLLSERSNSCCRSA